MIPKLAPDKVVLDPPVVPWLNPAATEAIGIEYENNLDTVPMNEPDVIANFKEPRDPEGTIIKILESEIQDVD